MKLRELYSGILFGEAFLRLQSMRAERSPEQKFETRIEGPEMIDDNFLINWLALNYMWTVDFDHQGNPIMGEIGGTVHTLPKGKLILAVSETSMKKVMYGLSRVQESRETNDDGIISQLETKIEMPLEFREGITVVNGNRNVAHYDFTTGVAHADPVEVITADLYLLLSADGITVLSNKKLPNEHYCLNIPANEELFRVMKTVQGNDLEERLQVLRSVRANLVPEEFIAGFHLKYEGNAVTVRPLIAERDSGICADLGVAASPSHLAYIGTSSAYGELNDLMKKGVLD